MEHAVSQRRGLLRQRQVCLVAVALLAVGFCSPVQCRDLFQAPSAPSLEEPEPPLEGYNYEGRVTFVDSIKPGPHTVHIPLPRSRADPYTAENAPALSHQELLARELEKEHTTILITRDGGKFTKRMATHPDDPAVQAAAKLQFAASAGHRPARVLQDVTKRTTVITDLTCNGCPTSDTRVQITDTTQYPYSAVGRLIGSLGQSNTGLECSGTLIGPRHVVTAAHCVFDINDSHKYVSSINFSPGLNAKKAPFGTVEWESVRVLNSFTNEGSYTPIAMNYDFALILLSEEVDSSAGSLGISTGTGTQTIDLVTAGYPGDKTSGTMWSSSCNHVQFDYTGAGYNNENCDGSACANVVQHTCISNNGQSGSGMWDMQLKVRAILTGKVYTSDNNQYNVGTKLNSFVYNTLAQWYNEDINSSSTAGGPASARRSPIPVAPPGPPPFKLDLNPGSWFRNVDWGQWWVILILAVIGVTLLVGAICGIRVCMRCCQPRRPPKVVVVQPNGTTAGIGRYPAPPPQGQPNGQAARYPVFAYDNGQQQVFYDYDARGNLVTVAIPKEAGRR